MKIWSRTLTHTELHLAAFQVNADFPGCDVYVANACTLYVGPRTRFIDKVSLASRTSTRYPNPGNGQMRVSDHHMAASWTEWGWWLARLFELDGDARCNHYRGREDFHAATNGRFLEPRNMRELQVVRHLHRNRDRSAA